MVLGITPNTKFVYSLNSSFKELLSFKFTHRHISVSLLVYIFTKKNLHKKL